jgi:hypothetical protein
MERASEFVDGSLAKTIKRKRRESVLRQLAHHEEKRVKRN